MLLNEYNINNIHKNKLEVDVTFINNYNQFDSIKDLFDYLKKYNFKYKQISILYC